MKDLGALMKQAQAMQEKLQAAQQRLAESQVEGQSGGGLVRLTLTGAGALATLAIEPSLIHPGDGELIADLVVAAHADAKRKLDEAQAEIMREVAGPLAGLTGLPGF
jgi:DNA-binding YbaB/EbfC family protein